jgi:D-alanyl-lipoteichoic acid acyltransferase DltB (MBOAT superfamily)
MVVGIAFATLVQTKFSSSGASADRGWWYMRTERLILPLSVVLAEWSAGIAVIHPLSQQFWTYFFSPLNFLFPLPVSTKQIHSQKNIYRLQLAGLFDIFVAGLCFWLTSWICYYLKIQTQINNPNFDRGPLMHMLVGYGTYLYYFINSFAVLRSATGLGRWFGFDLPDAYHYPLFAANPQDRWRRWNIYFYNWFMAFVFLPLFRKTRSTLLSVFAVFFVTFLLHEFGDSVGVIFGRHPLGAVWLVQSKIWFFMAHAAVIYIAVKTAKFWPSGKTIAGWLGVLLTHFLMAWVHWIVS